MDRPVARHVFQTLQPAREMRGIGGLPTTVTQYSCIFGHIAIVMHPLSEGNLHASPGICVRNHRDTDWNFLREMQLPVLARSKESRFHPAAILPAGTTSVPG